MTTSFWLYPLQRTIGLALPCAVLLASTPALGEHVSLYPSRQPLMHPAVPMATADRPLPGQEAASRDWRAHSLRSQALFDSAFRSVERGRIRGPQASISTERIRLLKLAVAELDSAEAEAGTTAEKALVRVQHGHILEVAGFPLDAHGWYSAALRSDSTNATARVALWRVTRELLGLN